MTKLWSCLQPIYIEPTKQEECNNFSIFADLWGLSYKRYINFFDQEVLLSQVLITKDDPKTSFQTQKFKKLGTKS